MPFDYEDFGGNFNNGKNIFAVVHFNDGKEKEALSILSKRSLDCLKGGFLAFILHDKDMEGDTPKTPHVHIVLESYKGQSKQNWITELAEGFGVSREAVGVKALGSRRGAVRYLTHIDFKDKYQYDPSEVITSSQSIVDACFAPVKSSNPTYDELMACNTAKDIYDLVGLSAYPKAKKAWEELNEDHTRKNYYYQQYALVMSRLVDMVMNDNIRKTGFISRQWFIEQMKDISDVFNEVLTSKEEQERIYGGTKK